MKYKIDVQHLLPVNIHGSESDAAASLSCQSETEASDRFKKLSEKLLQINNWNRYAKKNPTDFYLYNKEGEKSARAQVNDLVKIKMPAPENKLGNGFDWVNVHKIEPVDQAQMKAFILQMKPHSCPESGKGDVAHFFKGDATNNFILAKQDNTIQFSIHGRNEIPNTKKVGFINSCRNFFVASGGIFGGSKVQWQEFADEFIKQ